MKTQYHIPITIRVQALGGMYLGPDSHAGAIITINDFHTKEKIVEGFTNNGNSGTRSTTFNDYSSQAPIVTPAQPTPVIHWVVANPSTVNFSTTIPLKKASVLEIIARVPLPPEQGDQVTCATQWLVPGSDLTTGAGFVLVVPGLWIQPEIVVHKKQVRIRAKVTMMCGCEINYNSPWLPEDFHVGATIKNKEGFEQELYFAFEENSQYTTDIKVPEAGDYEVSFYASQSSTINRGYARKYFSVKRKK
jgi:hypothetical protein